MNMAKINMDFYDGQDIYNDGDVENLLLDSYKNGKNIDITKNDLFYLTTDIRTNILNWYPFTKNDDVLEIGCGCGTLTELLCNKCKTVTCIEGSKRRAEITYYRHQNKKNLEIFAGNFNSITLEKKFDYIVLIGVFEYAKRFFESDKPFHMFLEKIKKLLKPDGKILIAIENRYGIKYWAGANEDHLYQPYIGLESYENTDIQTFGKEEFIDLIKSFEFTKYKFYYPFPDYKLPTVIFTDERLPTVGEIPNIPIYLYGNSTNFNISKVLNGLIDNKMFGFFSNSFVVEFGYDDCSLSNIVYAKNLPYRKNEFKSLTIQEKDIGYKKIPLFKSVNKHLDNLVKNHKLLNKNNIEACNVTKQNNEYIIEEIKGIDIVSYIDNLSRNKDWIGVEKEIDNIVQFYNSISSKKTMQNPIIEDLKNIYKNETNILNISLLDGNISNIVRREKDDKYIFIDQEWIDDRELPSEYLIYQSIALLFGTIESINYKYTFADLCKKYEITSEKINVFNQITSFYYNEKNNIIDQNSNKILEGCSQISYKDWIDTWPVIYYDTGKGFNQEEKIVSRFQNKSYNNIYSISVAIPKDVKKIRFDPSIEGKLFVKIGWFRINGKEFVGEEINIINYNDLKLLIEAHPHFIFEVENERFLNIEIQMEELSSVEIIEFFEKKELENINEINSLNENNLFLKNQLNLIKNSRSWKMLEKFRKIKSKK